MPHPHRSRFSISTSTKIALGIVVVVAIVAFLYYNPSGFSFGAIPVIGGDLTNIFGGQPAGERFDFTMKSSENFFKDELRLEDATVTVSGIHVIDTSVGDSVFSNLNEQATVSFAGFNGRMSIKNGILSVSGTAIGASSGETRIKPKAGSFSVEAQLAPSGYSISPVTIDKINLVRVYGSIEKIGYESTTTQLANSTVGISGFQGAMLYDGTQYTLTGSAVEIKGKSFTLKG